MILDSTTEKITLVLAGATTTNPGDCYGSWTDSDPAASPTFNAGDTAPQTNGTTSVDLVPVPGSATARRSVEELSVVNTDTQPMTVTIRHTDGVTHRKVFGPCTIQVGEKIQFKRDSGWNVLTASGAVKTSLSSPPTSTYFEASLTVTQTPVTAATFTTIVFNNEIFDPSNAYNPATGVWTVPETGKYLISAFAHEAGFADGANVVVSVFVAGAESMRLGEQLPSNPTGNVNAGCQVGSSIVMRLTAGQQVTIRGLIGAAAGGATLRFTGTAGGELTYFRAMRVE